MDQGQVSEEDIDFRAHGLEFRERHYERADFYRGALEMWKLRGDVAMVLAAEMAASSIEEYADKYAEWCEQEQQKIEAKKPH